MSFLSAKERKQILKQQQELEQKQAEFHRKAREDLAKHRRRF